MYGLTITFFKCYKFHTVGTVRHMLWRHFILLITGLLLLAARWFVMGATVPKFMKVDNPASFLDNIFLRVR